MDQHAECLRNLCRICGTRFSRNTRKAYQCVTYEKQLEIAFGIKISVDNDSVHPKLFCASCFAGMRRHEVSLKNVSSYLSTLSPRQWLPHSDDYCETCITHNSKAKGGRPKKTKQPGRPPSSGVSTEHLGTSALIHEVRVKMLQLPSFRPTNDAMRPSDFLPLPPPMHIRQFTCIICSNIIDQPIELRCSHMFCGECLIEQIQSGNSKCQQPNCDNVITQADIKPPSELVMLSLGSLQYTCTRGSCNATVPLQNVSTHSRLCTGLPPQSQGPSTPSSISLRQVLNAPVDKTPSTIERRVLGHLTKRIMQSSSDHGSDTTITVATGGQVCFSLILFTIICVLLLYLALGLINILLTWHKHRTLYLVETDFSYTPSQCASCE